MHSNIRLTLYIILCVGEMGVARYINPHYLKILDPALILVLAKLYTNTETYLLLDLKLT